MPSRRQRFGRALLDVNVLVALAWPNHVGHSAARGWFTREAAKGWATTPVTESGFVRVSSNRRALPTATTPAIAIEMLGQLTGLPGHEFWPDRLRLVTGDRLDPTVVTGYRQVTDAHLIALCLENGASLVTFDSAIAALCPEDAGVLQVLHADPEQR